MLEIALSLILEVPASNCGESVDVSGTIRVVGAPNIDRAFIIDDSGQTELIMFNTSFGNAVATDGASVLIGAKDENGSGAAHLFEKIDGEWSLVHTFVPPQPQDDMSFGYSVDVDGSRVVIGARRYDNLATAHDYEAGAAYLFTLTDGTWDSGTSLIGLAGSYRYHGAGVAIQGNTAVVGAPAYGPAQEGAVVIYDGAEPIQVIHAQDYGIPDAHPLGRDVAIDGDLIVLGTYEDDLKGIPGVLVFRRQFDGTWEHEDTIYASDGQVGDHFGFAVDVSGNTIIVGAHRDENLVGSAYVFSRTGNQWQETAKVLGPDWAGKFGRSVAIDGDAMVIGAPNADKVFSASLVAPGCVADLVNSATFAPPGDGVVDAADLAYLLGQWGNCQ